MTEVTGVTELAELPVDRLQPHPDNPRLQLRTEIVDQLAAEMLRTGFGAEHALLVRPVDGGHQIVSGHHRWEAAKQARLDRVPCWVKPMDDDQAFMQLILCNTQGELSRIERAVHAFRAGERAEGHGRGQTGGLSDYARQLDIAQQRASEQYAVGELVERYRLSGTFQALIEADPYKALTEITRAPRDAQTVLVGELLQRGWTVADTKRKVGELKRFEIPDIQPGWLPLDRVIAAYLTDGRPTPNAVAKLCSTVEGILDHIRRDGTEADEDTFRSWLVANAGDASWDHRQIAQFHADLIVEWADRDAEIDNGRVRIYPTSCADLIQHLDPGTVDLIFTDPPYPVEFVDCWTELGQLAVKALKPGGLLVAYTGQYTMPDALDRLREAGLSWFWCYAVQHDGAFFRMNATHVQCGWKPLLVMRNGSGDLPNWHKDVIADGSREKADHDWQQSEAEAGYWISELSRPDDLVVDPFVGGGTTAVASKALGRRFVGADIDPNHVETARERVSQ